MKRHVSTGEATTHPCSVLPTPGRAVAILARPTVVLVAVLSLPSILLAGNDTTPLLESPNVHGVIRLRVSSDGKRLTYARLQDPEFRDLPPSNTFLSRHAVSIRIASYNPMTLGYSTKMTSEPDPNYKAMEDFLSSLVALGKQVAPGTPGPFATQGTRVGREESPCEIAGHAIQMALKESPLTSAVVEAWAAGATGRVGISMQLGEQSAPAGPDSAKPPITVRQAIRTITDKIDAIQKALPTIENWLKKAEKPHVPEEPKDAKKKDAKDASKATPQPDGSQGESEAACTFPTDPELKFKLSGLYVLGQQALLPLKALLLEVTTLESQLNDLSGHRDRWFAADGREEIDYEILRTEDPFSKKLVIHLETQNRSYSVKDSTLMVKESDKAAFDLNVRSYSPIVPEVAAAVLYNEVTYRRYGTATVGGKTVVALADGGPGRIDAALMANLLIRPLNGRWFCPMFQLGLSSAKDFPGLLAGFGIRFPKVSLSVGRMVTWSKELDSLHVGDEISGTAALDADLKLKRTPPAWYGSIQYSF